MRVRFAVGSLVACLALLIGAGSALAHAKPKQVLTVCKHGCKFHKIQKAVDKSGKNAVIKVKPGTYREGVIVEGHKHDGLTIKGTSQDPRKTILEGKNAQTPDGLAQNGIEGSNVNGLKMMNMWARNYATNGFFVHTDNTNVKKTECHNWLMKNLVASYNRSYGLYAFRCIGGRITESVGYGHGDSAFYIGGTPPQSKPKWTSIDHSQGYENVLGFSGTNSRYININNDQFYNNGVGVVPNTLDSEPYEPNTTGIIQDNQIFWNNFNYFLPNSKVTTVSSGLGTIEGIGTVQYPTGAGVVLLGSDGWKVKSNEIFGNFKWGVALVSDPFNEGDNAINNNNQVTGNHMGRGGKDTNATDFWNQGSGKGNCFQDNGSSATYDPGSEPNSTLYPPCPTTLGTGTSVGDGAQFGELAAYVTANPPETQECSWTQHSHPAYRNYKSLTITPGPTCP